MSDRIPLRASLAIVLLLRRPDWPHRIAPPRIIVGVIAAGSAGLGLILMFEDAHRTTGPTFRVMSQWGRDVGFHAHPMAVWGMAFLAASLVTAAGLVLLMPVLSGVGVTLQASLLGLYDSGAWVGTAIRGHSAAHPGHGTVGPIIGGPSFSGPLILLLTTVWWVLSAGALLSIRHDKPWPFR